MKNRTIQLLKPIVFLVCLLPFVLLLRSFVAQNLGADPVATITQVTGSWALYLLLVSLAVTPVRRLSSKLAWLIRFRRMLGLFAFFYATLHLATYVFLFSGFDIATACSALQHGQWAVVVQQWKIVWPIMVADAKQRTFIQIGLIAWIMLLALALTSPQWVMRRMGGKPWQRLHRAVYLAAVLAVLHYWWIVKSGVLEPWKVTAVLVLLLGARVVWTVQKKRAATKSAI